MDSLRIFSIFVVILLFASSVFAIGVTPGRYIVSFTPGMNRTFDITVINNENRPLLVGLFVRDNCLHCGLAQYVQFNYTTTNISPSSNMALSYSIKLPTWLAGPKRYDTRIGAVEVPEGGGIGAVAGSEQQLWIDVPNTTRPDVVEGELPEILPSQPVAKNKTSEITAPKVNPLAGIFIMCSGAVIFIIVLLVLFLHRKHRK